MFIVRRFSRRRSRVAQLLCVCVATGCAFGVTTAAAVDYAEEDITDPAVRHCLQKSLPDKSASQQIRFHTYENDQLIGESAANLYWKRFPDGGSRALIRLTAPPRKIGLALLAQENADKTLQQDVTVYLPELRANRRIVGKALSGSMFGTDFSYEDFVQLQGVLQHRAVRRLDDESIDARAVYAIETIPRHEESRYSRIVTYIDQTWCVATRLHFYGGDDALAKEITVDPESVTEVSGRWVPHAVTLVDHEDAGRTELVIERVEVNPELRDNLFTASELRRGR